MRVSASSSSMGRSTVRTRSRHPRAPAPRAPHARHRAASAAHRALGGNPQARALRGARETLGDRLLQALKPEALLGRDPYRQCAAIGIAIDARRQARADRSCCRPRSAESACAPISASTASTCAICSSRRASLASTTCSSSVASRASVSVDWKAATSSCGSARMKPTVSATTTGVPPGRLTRRTVGSSVAKS